MEYQYQFLLLLLTDANTPINDPTKIKPVIQSYSKYSGLIIKRRRIGFFYYPLQKESHQNLENIRLTDTHEHSYQSHRQ